MTREQLADVVRCIDEVDRKERDWLLYDFLSAAWPTPTAQNSGPPTEQKQEEQR
jgi:hypothetical protein